MTIEELNVVLGQPMDHSVFVADRTTYDFCIGNMDAYTVGCTVHDDHGLIYMTVHRRHFPELSE
jgi:hypothetical protein